VFLKKFLTVFEIKINLCDFLLKGIDTIIKCAKSGDCGTIGDGKIFVTNLEECLRIRTNERGGVAI